MAHAHNAHYCFMRLLYTKNAKLIVFDRILLTSCSALLFCSISNIKIIKYKF